MNFIIYAETITSDDKAAATKMLSLESKAIYFTHKYDSPKDRSANVAKMLQNVETAIHTYVCHTMDNFGHYINYGTAFDATRLPIKKLYSSSTAAEVLSRELQCDGKETRNGKKCADKKGKSRCI